MAKIFIYSIVLVTLLAVVNMAGLPTATNTVLSSFDFFNASGWASSNVVATIIALIIGSALIGISAAYTGRSPSESYLITTLFAASGILIAFIIDIGSLVAYVQGNYPDMAWMGNILGLFFGAVIVGYAFAMIQFWRGNDI